MADLIATPPLRSVSSRPHNPDRLLTDVVVGAVVVAALALGRDLLIPIALAVLLSFVLEPLQRVVRRTGLGRAPSVLIVVAIVFVAILSLGATFVREAGDLAANLPQYEGTITQKISSLRGALGSGHALQDATSALRRIGSELTGPRPDATTSNAAAGAQTSPTGQKPLQVEIQRPAPTPFDILQGAAATALAPLATASIVAIFTIVILLQREDLRDRMIRLAGLRDLQRATTAIDETTRRLSRYFLAQLLVNTAFGIIVGLGLTVLGVPSATLWGILAMILRFIPYIGASLAGVFPVALAAAIDPGWTIVLLTIAMFLVIDTITGQIVEPLLYGHSTGLSPLAVIVAATFWTWLWGPVGLLMSTPLTLCFFVLGQHVERLEFLEILLGNAPPLTPSESFYQRMLAGHPAEAAEQAETFLKTRSLGAYYDEIAVGGLMLAFADFQRGRLDEARQLKIRGYVDDMLEDVEDHKDISPVDSPSKETGGDQTTATADKRDSMSPDGETAEDALLVSGEAICVGGRGLLDDAAAAMLAQLLRSARIVAKDEPHELLARDRVTPPDPRRIQLACLSYLGNDVSIAQVRYGVRRLRRRLPGSIILVGLWAAELDEAKLEEIRIATHADLCAASLQRAVELCFDAVSASQDPGDGQAETSPHSLAVS